MSVGVPHIPQGGRGAVDTKSEVIDGNQTVEWLSEVRAHRPLEGLPQGILRLIHPTGKRANRAVVVENNQRKSNVPT
jgi:hypothetical protein